MTTSQADAQVLLQLVNPNTGALTESLPATAGTNFTLDIDVQDLTSTQALAGFDLSLSSLPVGITLNSFTQVLPDFVPNANSPASLFYSADDGDSSEDVAINAMPTNILQANFTLANALTPGTYYIDFEAPGLFQDIDDDNGNPITYTDQKVALVVTSAPEPNTTLLFALGMAIILRRLVFFKRIVSNDEEPCLYKLVK